jgi:hypothetical protein
MGSLPDKRSKANRREISNENIVVASFDDVPEEVCKAFEECKKAREEKEMQELLTCYTKDHHGSVTQVKELVLPPIDSTKEVHTTKVLHSSTFVTPKDVCLHGHPAHRGWRSDRTC